MDTLRDMLQRGMFSKSSHVWKEGMVQWQEAGLVEELMPLFAVAPPPLPPGLGAAPPPVPPAAQAAAPAPAAAPKVYQIGETGPAGGYVCYDKGVMSDGWRYLEAAPVGAEFSANWGSRTDVPGTSDAMGAGKRNTQLIVDRIGTNSAAFRCATLNINGYADWFMPSFDELELMYRNLALKGIGGFGSGYYGASTQNDRTTARGLRFSDGNRAWEFKDRTQLVRAIRAF